MICFEVYHEERPPYREGPDADLSLLVNGTRKGEMLQWVEMDIKVGDEIRVRNSETAAADPPDRKTAHEQRQSAREVRRELYLKLK